jgi:AraC family transcriptional regulator
LGKIAPGPTSRVIAQGNGWTVSDVLCASGPRDRPFEERHTRFSIAIVAAGSFQYRSARGRALMAPGCILLGNDGQCFECSHEHGAGDRCIAFRFAREYFERIAADAGASTLEFEPPRLPPMRATSRAIARACAGLAGASISWEDLAIQIAACAIQIAAGLTAGSSAAPPSAEARVTRSIRFIENRPLGEMNLASLAREAGLSPYHFLRTFQRLTGVTPHQFILRQRLRDAALRLVLLPDRILDIALDCGFGDVSNFNHAFRAEFGLSPRRFRLAMRPAS